MIIGFDQKFQMILGLDDHGFQLIMNFV